MTVRTQTRYPTTVVSDDAVGTLAWSDPSKAEVEDNDPATATGPGTSEWLKHTGYGFTLPSDAVPVAASAKPRLRGGGKSPAWTVIGSQTLAAPAASVSFPGISTTYRMFRVTAYVVKDGTGGAVAVRLNNDSGANYDRQRLLGDGSSLSANRATGQTEFDVSGSSVLSANETGTYEVVIAKQLSGVPALMHARNVHNVTGPSIRATAVAGRWGNTADLMSRIDLIAGTGSFAAGTVVVLEAM